MESSAAQWQPSTDSNDIHYPEGKFMIRCFGDLSALLLCLITSIY